MNQIDCLQNRKNKFIYTALILYSTSNMHTVDIVSTEKEVVEVVEVVESSES